LEHRAEAHILIAFIAYGLQITLKHRRLPHAPGLKPTAVLEKLEKLAEIQMIDVWIPAVDQRWLILPRYTQPSADTKLLIEKLRLELPSQPPPRLTARKESNEIEPRWSASWPVCGGDLSITSTDSKALNWTRSAQLRKIG
jgi:hypothetical protein